MKPVSIDEAIMQRLIDRAEQENCSINDLLTRFLDASTPASSSPSSTIPYQQLLERTTDTISLFDLELRYLYVNPVLGRLTGLDPAKMIGKSDRELGMPEENVEFWKTEWQKVIDTRQEHIIAFEFTTYEGLRAYESRLTPILDENEGLISLLAITRDITERKNLERRQKRLIDELELVINTAKLGVWYLDLSTNQLTWNDQQFAIYGITEAEFSRDMNSWRKHVHPDDIDYADTRLQAVYTEGFVSDVNFRVIHKNGDIHYISASANTIRNEHNEVTALIGVNMDVSHIREQDISLQQTSEMLQSIIEHIPVMIALFDNHGRFQFVNREWIKRLGWTVEELAQQADPLILFYPDPDYRKKALDYMISGQPGWKDFQTNSKSGESLDITWANVRLSDGRSIGIGQDISERKFAEQTALEKERLLASLKLEKDHSATVQRIVEKLAHDIKTPLSVIAVSRDILTNYFERLDANQRRERLENMHKQLQYVTELLNDLSRIKDVVIKPGELRLTPTNMEMLCQITTQDFQESIGSRHKINFINEHLVDFAMVDHMLINRIFLNLLSNAIKYSPEGSQVTITLGKQSDWIVIRVSDQGIGISQQDLEHIFEPFYRVDAVKHVEGTGLGLSIVKECVELHRGSISVESTPEQGTTFTVKLPFIPVSVLALH